MTLKGIWNLPAKGGHYVMYIFFCRSSPGIARHLRDCSSSCCQRGHHLISGGCLGQRFTCGLPIFSCLSLHSLLVIVFLCSCSVVAPCCCSVFLFLLLPVFAEPWFPDVTPGLYLLPFQCCSLDFVLQYSYSVNSLDFHLPEMISFRSSWTLFATISALLLGLCFEVCHEFSGPSFTCHDFLDCLFTCTIQFLFLFYLQHPYSVFVLVTHLFYKITCYCAISSFVYSWEYLPYTHVGDLLKTLTPG